MLIITAPEINSNYTIVTFYKANEIWVRFYNATCEMQYSRGYAPADSRDMHLDILEWTREGTFRQTIL